MMPNDTLVSETELAELAKRYREKAGKTRAQAARELGVSQTSIFQAEEKPEYSLSKLRSRIIEAYSDRKVTGPFYQIKGSTKVTP